MLNADQHYCKHCNSDFRIDIHEDETGDFFLECPQCRWKHYRRFEKGVAVHCEITKRKVDPIVVRGK